MRAIQKKEKAGSVQTNGKMDEAAVETLNWPQSQR